MYMYPDVPPQTLFVGDALAFKESQTTTHQRALLLFLISLLLRQTVQVRLRNNALLYSGWLEGMLIAAVHPCPMDRTGSFS